MRRLLLVLVCLWGVGCEAQPTPVAVVPASTQMPDTVTEAAPTAAGTSAPFTIGLSQAVIDYGKGLGDWQAFGTISPISDPSDTSAFDLVMGYGLIDGWAQSPTTHHLILLLNTRLAPLDAPEIAVMVRQSLDTRALVNALGIDGLRPNTDLEAASPIAHRTQLANLGYPDGLALTLAAATNLGRDVLIQQMRQHALDLAVVETDPAAIDQPISSNTAHLAFFIATDAERDQLETTYENALMDLVALPISYRLMMDAPLTFSAAGWPIPQRLE